MANMRYIVITKKSMIISLCIVVSILLSLLYAAAVGPAISAAANKKQLPIYCTTQKEKIASFSFDAAWGNEDTELLISILAKYNVKATFFLVGEWVDKYPESVKALSDAGHEIQNHSDTHPHMPQLSREEMISQIKICNDKIEAITGKRPILFRAPYGDYSNTLIEVIKSQGMYCIQWDVDSLDWKDKTAEQIISKVTNQTENGSIVLFHNAALNTPEALPAIIEKLQADGYSLVPVSKQVYTGNYIINHEGRQVPSLAAVTTAAMTTATQTTANKSTKKNATVTTATMGATSTRSIATTTFTFPEIDNFP